MSTNSLLNSKPRNFKPTKINDFTVYLNILVQGQTSRSECEYEVNQGINVGSTYL